MLFAVVVQGVGRSAEKNTLMNDVTAYNATFATEDMHGLIRPVVHVVVCLYMV